MTLDRFLRFRYLSKQSDETFFVSEQGILATNYDEEHQTTFQKAFPISDGDLLEIEYPASYGYFLFGESGNGKWRYTSKT